MWSEEHHLSARLRAHFPENAWELDGLWARVHMERLPEQCRAGWKLHVSSVPAEFGALLDAALPVLAAAGAPFKVLRSAELLEAMNDGRYGLMQVGKALTVYPAEEAEAAELAASLAKTLAGFQGPHIPSDTRFAQGAPVFFRYGPYDGRFQVDATGQRQRLLRLPDGRDVVDAPGQNKHLPLPALLPRRAPYDHLAFLREHFELLRLLQLSARGATLLARLKAARDPEVQAAAPLLLIKTARRGTHADRHGRDAVWALAREHYLLERLAGLGGIPTAGVLLRDGEEVAALVRPWVDGQTFAELWSMPDARLPRSSERLQQLLQGVWQVVRELHARGLVVRDLAPGNLLQSVEGPLLLDLELAHELGAGEPRYRRGTRGFYPPDPDVEPGPQDDCYALRALALMAHTGAHPAWWGRLPDRAQLAASVGGAPRFLNAWEQCETAPDAGMDLLLEAISAQPRAADGLPEETRERVRTAWCALLQEELTRPRDSSDPEQVNVYSGLAGLLLSGLSWEPVRTRSMLGEQGWAHARTMLSGALQHLAHIPGLHFGASGVALALLGGGTYLADQDACAEARAVLLDLERLRTSIVPDLCQGVAGQVQALLAAHRLDGDEAWRDAASAAGRHLLSLEDTAEPGIWPWPQGDYGALAGARYLGFAHGTAGVVHTLLLLHELAPDSVLLDAARRGLTRLQETAQRVRVDDGEFVWWPVSASDSTVWNAWCHGTPGIIKALAKAVQVDGDPAWRTLLEEALKGMQAANNAHVCLCHGVASRLDALLDARGVLEQAAQARLDRSARAEAALLAGVDLAAATAPPHLMPAGGEHLGLMTGPAGVLYTLLRYFGEVPLKLFD